MLCLMSQLSAEAEGKVNVDQSMLEGGKTGKGRSDLMLLLIRTSIEGRKTMIHSDTLS